MERSSFSIFALIPTHKRSELLYRRSLPSTICQARQPDGIVVIDDNPLAYKPVTVPTSMRDAGVSIDVIRNSRTPGLCGALNSALMHLLVRGTHPDRTIVALLDDDDRWHEDHLSQIAEMFRRGCDFVSTGMNRFEHDTNYRTKMPPDDLIVDDFIVGNPGIQGSNFSVRLSSLLMAGGFDEALSSCTDRDMVIRLGRQPHLTYGSCPSATVDHFACKDRPRLSTPRSVAKNKGLSGFYRKYSPVMSPDQQSAFEERANRIFGWQKQDAEPPRNPQTHSGLQIAAVDEAVHLVVGVISDVGRLKALERLFSDLINLSALDQGISVLDVVVLENAPGEGVSPGLGPLIEQYRRSDLRLFHVRQHDFETSSSAPMIRWSIAEARSALQQALQLHTRYLRQPVVWILDDDMRLNPLISDQGHVSRRWLPLSPLISKLRADGVEIGIGSYTGAAPLPMAFTVRTQLLDLVWNLRRLDNMSPTERLVAEQQEDLHARTETYHDVPVGSGWYLERPTIMGPAFPGETAGQAIDRLLDVAESLLAGDQVFRPLTVELADYVACRTGDGLHRGGNTLILNADILRRPVNPSARIQGRMARRSDMIWAYLQANIDGRNVRSIPLATYHDRSELAVPDRLDVDGLVDDIRGHAVFSALPLRADPEEAAEFAVAAEEQRLAAFSASCYRIRGLAAELADWARTRCSAQKHQQRWLAIADQTAALFSRSAVDALTCTLRSDRGEIAGFFKSLDSLKTDVDAKRSPEHAGLRTRRLKDRVANAVAMLQEAGMTNLVHLGSGDEGVVMQMGERVLKVFNRRVPEVERHVGRWPDGKGLVSVLNASCLRGVTMIEMPYRDTTEYVGGRGPGLVRLLATCHALGLVCSNIHPKNLRASGQHDVVLIDYGSDIVFPAEPDRFETGFRHMCNRAFLSWRWAWRSDLAILMERALTQPDLPELEGVDYFVRAVEEATGKSLPYDPVIDMVLARNPARVLDVGAGKGEQSRVLLETVPQMFAYDPDPDMQDRLRNIQRLTVLTDMESAERDGPFDTVLCRRVGCQIDDLALATLLKDIRRVVAADGYVVFAVCHPGYTAHANTYEGRAAQPSEIGLTPPKTWVKHLHRSASRLTEHHRSESLLKRLMWRAGFSVVARHTRDVVDQNRFEPASDLLVYELKPREVADATLMIKACAMEMDTLDIQVRHLVETLSQPAGFKEVILALDTRVSGFPRPHCDGDIERVRAVADRLIGQGWIDRYVEPPSDPEELLSLNKRWMGRHSDETHATNGAQLAAVFCGFEACRSAYVLHVDADVMIGRVNPDHDYLAEMKDLLRCDEQALTVSLSIARHEPLAAGCMNDEGEPWRVESRAGLVDLKRLQRLLPISFQDAGSGGTLPWHRALDRVVASRRATSWRGGDQRAFFVHPENGRKTDHDAWFTVLSEIERGGFPSKQSGNVNWVGDVADWLRPERFEPFIFIVAGRNVLPQRFRRCLDSMLRQRNRDWGAVVIDDGSEPSIADEIAELCRPHSDRLSFVRRKARGGLLTNMVEVIGLRCGNPNSVIVTLDADDCLVGRNVLDVLSQAYADGADATVGSMLRLDKQKSYPVDFVNPRAARGGNVWQHLRSFRKDLFDGIPDEYLRIHGKYVDVANDWAYMMPIIERAQNPVHLSVPLYLYERSVSMSPAEREARENIIEDLVSRAPLETYMRS